MKITETSARYTHSQIASHLGVETFTLSDSDVIVSLTPRGPDMTMDVWVVDEVGEIHVVPNATILRFEAQGAAMPNLIGHALAIVRHTLMAGD